MAGKKTKLEQHEIEGVELLFTGMPTLDAAAFFVPLSQIQLPKKQSRRYFDPIKLDELSSSIKKNGILEPLLVRPTAAQVYELVAGERRYQAAQLAGLDEVPVVIRELTEEEAFELSLIENLQREDLNPVEETEGILELLTKKLNCSRETVISLLQKAAHPERESGNNVVPTKEWNLIEDVFASIGRFSPISFRSHRLRLLNLSDEILEVLRKGQIEYTKALAIGRVKDEKQRRSLLQFAMAQNLSLNQIKERLKQLDNKNAHESPSLKQRFTTLSSKIQKSKVWDNHKKQKQLEKLVADFEARIQKLLENN